MEGVLLSAVGPQHAELLIVLTHKSAAAAAFSGAEGTSHAQVLGPSGPWATTPPWAPPPPGPAALRVHLCSAHLLPMAVSVRSGWHREQDTDFPRATAGPCPWGCQGASC